MRNKEIKDFIIQETKALLLERKNVTIKDIAERCFINIASVNYHFGSKDALIYLVVEKVIEELKANILMVLQEHKHEEKNVLIEEMIKFTYNFALENMGMLYYLFINQDGQQKSANLFITTFFTDNEFTKMIFKEIKVYSDSADNTTIFARYMILFSSFCMPLFISILKSDGDNSIETFKDEHFRNVFIKELLRIIDTN